MKSTFKILSICIWLILPLSVNAESCDSENCNLCSDQTTCEQDNNHGVCRWNGSNCVTRCTATEATTCNQSPGCEWNGLECSPCMLGTYNEGGTNANGCQPCSLQNGHPYLDDGTNRVPNLNQTYGQSECPWICAFGYYKANNPDSATNTYCIACPLTAHADFSEEQQNIGSCASSCTTLDINGASLRRYIIKTNLANEHVRYYCGTCGAGTISSENNNIVTCASSCYANANLVQGQASGDTAASQQNIIDPDKPLVECQCPYLSGIARSEDTPSCGCGAGYSMQGSGPSGFYCSQCGANASSVPVGTGSVCQCNTGYWGDGRNGCTACPKGTTTVTNSSFNTNFHPSNITNKSACHVTNATKFCDANGQNCMKLVPQNDNNATTVDPQQGHAI